MLILGNEVTRQNRLLILILTIGLTSLLLISIIGAPIYYYKYTRNDKKASISKNPNYGLFISV